MNTDSRNPGGGRPPIKRYTAQRREPTVRDILSKWVVKRPTYSLSPSLSRVTLVLVILLACLLVTASVLLIAARDVYFDTHSRPSGNEGGSGVVNNDGERPFADGASGNMLLQWADNTKIIPADSIHASYAALADLSTGEIFASRKADEKIYPASMTKVMTLIVVVENLPSEDSLQELIEISPEVYEEMKREGSSGIGLEPGEKLSVESLLYALMLRSDGIAACELAKYVAGSVDNFVELMNQKAEKMGLSNTHFENPTGLHHPDHHSTSREIATIMAYAMNMKLCRRILVTQSYTAPCQGADGKTFNYNLYHNLIVTQFENISPNQPTAVTVAAGKTGFTDESRYCLVTYAESADGHGYVCVTAKGGSYAECIEDYLTIYNTYVKP